MKIRIVNPDKQTVLQYLSENKINLSAPCAGKGTCGKCKIKVLSGEEKVTVEEKKFFSKQELEDGYRLACRVIAKDGMEVEVDIEKDKTFQIVSSYERVRERAEVNISEGYGVAIDIGTTTVAMELIDLHTVEIVGMHTTLNSQKQYGADVISRINFSANGGVERLKNCIQQDILEGIEVLRDQVKAMQSDIKKVVIAGNTTMLHTLLGLNCESLGCYPFTPTILDLVEYSFKEVFKQSKIEANLTLLPGISTYVGADITSGLYYCKLDKANSVKLFIDIGTNGEMAIGNKGKIISLATAAGPAFEGGNISKGVGSINGAICAASYEGRQFICKTIGGGSPIGICGSGLIDVMAECIKHELIDETGYIVDESEEIVIYEDNKNRITLTQADIRQVQLAKAAIRAGVEALIQNYGVNYEEIEAVYLAGGFGKYITKESMVILGLIPREIERKVIKVGNSALGGCVDYLVEKNSLNNLMSIRNNCQAINLAESIEFNDLFVQHMMFEG